MDNTILIKALQLVLALSFLVIWHEFGHYSLARLFGVKVEKFYLFFDPWFSLFKWKPKAKPLKEGETEDSRKPSWRDTEYGVGWLPLGGYVKIAGMIDESMDKEQMKQPAKPWEFRTKPAWQRLLIMIAGVVFNFIQAVIIYAGIVWWWGEEYITFDNATYGMEYSEAAHAAGYRDGDIPLLADGVKVNSPDDILRIINAKEVTARRGDSTVVINQEGMLNSIVKDANDGKDVAFMTYRFPVFVDKTEKGLGAAEAGLQHGDHIVAVNDSAALSYATFTQLLTDNKGRTVKLSIERDGKPLDVTASISEGGKLGFQLMPLDKIYKVDYVRYSFFESIPRGWALGVDRLTGYVKQLKLIFTKEGAQSIGGFGAIGSIFPDQWDWRGFWEITAFLAIILAFMNILPIPALDGGHVLFLIAEIVTRRKPSEKLLEYAQVTGMVILFALLIYANGNDIYRFFFK